MKQGKWLVLVAALVLVTAEPALAQFGGFAGGMPGSGLPTLEKTAWGIYGWLRAILIPTGLIGTCAWAYCWLFAPHHAKEWMPRFVGFAVIGFGGAVLVSALQALVA